MAQILKAAISFPRRFCRLAERGDLLGGILERTQSARLFPAWASLFRFSKNITEDAADIFTRDLAIVGLGAYLPVNLGLDARNAGNADSLREFFFFFAVWTVSWSELFKKVLGKSTTYQKAQ